MRRWLIGLLLALCAQSAVAATPGLIQADSCASSQTDVYAGSPTYNCQFTHPSLSGNLLTTVFSYSANGQTITVTDNESQTWSDGACVENSTDTQFVCVYYFPNTAAGVTTVKIAFSANTPYMQGLAEEWNNVATSSPLDLACHTNTGSSASITAGSMTTVTNGDLIVNGAMNTNVLNHTITAGSGFTLATIDNNNGDTYAQYEVQTTAGAINATMTQSATGRFASVACAFKSASAGTALPSGLRVIHRENINTNNETASSWTNQLPVSGNAIIVGFSSSIGYSLSSISDGTNTYTQVCNASLTTVRSELFYAKAVTPGSVLTLTFTMSGSDSSGNGVTFTVFDVAGAATSPLDTSYGSSGCASATGDQTSGAGTVTTFTATPFAANELSVAIGSQDFNTANGCPTPSGATFLATTYSGQPEPSFADENNYACSLLTASTSSQTYELAHTTTENSGNIGNWAVVGLALAPPSGASTSVPQVVVIRP